MWQSMARAAGHAWGAVQAPDLARSPILLPIPAGRHSPKLQGVVARSILRPQRALPGTVPGPRCACRARRGLCAVAVSAGCKPGRRSSLFRPPCPAVWDLASTGLFAGGVAMGGGAAEGGEGAVYNTLVGLLEAAYRGNRAPLPVFVHTGWLVANQRDVRRFVGEPCCLPSHACGLWCAAGWRWRACMRRCCL